MPGPSTSSFRNNRCCVKGCFPVGKVHRFPINPNICAKWAIAVQMDQLTIAKLPKSSKSVCSKHFADSAYTSRFRETLNKFAVPTLYLPNPQKEFKIKEHITEETGSVAIFGEHNYFSAIKDAGQNYLHIHHNYAKQQYYVPSSPSASLQYHEELEDSLDTTSMDLITFKIEPDLSIDAYENSISDMETIEYSYGHNDENDLYIDSPQQGLRLDFSNIINQKPDFLLTSPTSPVDNLVLIPKASHFDRFTQTSSIKQRKSKKLLKRIKMLKRKIQAFRSQQLPTEYFRKMTKNLSDQQRDIFAQRLANTNHPFSDGQDYSVKTKILALCIYKIHPESYEFFRKMLALPPMVHTEQWLSIPDNDLDAAEVKHFMQLIAGHEN